MRLRVVYRLKCLMVNAIKLFYYMSIAVVRVCRALFIQMWYKNRVQTLYESVHSLSRTRKCMIIALILLLILLYLWPSRLSFGRSGGQQFLMPHKWLSATSRPLDQADLCLEAKLEQFGHGVETFDVIINHSPIFPLEKFYLPYVGNGYIGVEASPSSQLYIKSGRTLSFPVQFYPVVEINLEGYHMSEAHVIHIVDGLVYRVQCFLVNGLCVMANSIYYVHRQHSSVLIQELRIHNPTDYSLAVDLRQIGVSDWTGVTTHNKRISTARASDIEYMLTTGTASVDKFSSYAIVIASLKLPAGVNIKASVTWTFTMVTTVRYELVQLSEVQAKITELSQLVQKELKDFLGIEANILRKNHSSVWHTLWSSGFGISLSKASGALNGDKINATMYYVLSHVPSFIHELGRPNWEKTQLENSLYFPDRCYDGHHTLQNTEMWRDFNKVNDVVQAAMVWLLTLEKQGCSTMLQAGADGVLQAMTLSYGALKFSNHHLEFGTHPRDLHRDYFFRRINYGNDTHVNISVQVGDDNKAVLYVSLDRNNRPYYACDAGCLDAPEPLSGEVRKLPVKLTDPVTPILYITADKQHMEELKHAIHVKSIDEAPAHEHHVMVLHKHGHHFGGLPMLFWGTIGLLITVFHLFLFKLIYNEYCSGSESGGSQRYPRHSGRYV